MAKRTERGCVAARRPVSRAAATPPRRRTAPRTTHAAQTDRLTLDTLLDMETVADPQLSPDGSQIIYTRGWVDKMNDQRESALWIMNADGSRNRFLAKGSGARWSPSGDRIAYTAPGRAEGVADLRALDGRRRRDLAGHARRPGARRPSRGRPTASSSRSRCWSRSATTGRSRCRRPPPAPSGPRRRASSSA